MRWIVVLLVLLAGCLDSDAASESEDPVESGDGDAGVGLDSEGGTAAAPVQVAPGTVETWYLHNTLTCTGDLCGCGSIEFSMNQTNTEGDCDNNGNRFGLSEEWGDCMGACYPAKQSMGAFPAGSVVEGTIYLTTDAVDEMDVSVKLVDRSGLLGGAEVHDVRVVGLGGIAHEAVDFQFELDHPVSSHRVRFDLGVHANVSYFVGYEEDHASHFRITAPAGA